MYDRYPPPNIVFRVRKYVPMGPVIMAKVKPRSLYMTLLQQTTVRDRSTQKLREFAYAGTAGVIFDFPGALGLESVWSSFSIRLFEWEIMRREVMARRCGRSSWHALGRIVYVNYCIRTSACHKVLCTPS